MRPLVALLIAALAVPGSLFAEEPSATRGTARLYGRLLRSDGKTPVSGAVVRACYLENGTSLASKPSDADGKFDLEGLLSGYADVVIETADGAFVVNQVMQFLPADKDSADFLLTRYTERPAEWWSGHEKRQVPCASADAAGSADMRARSTAGSFLKSGLGIGLLAGAGALLLVAAASGSGDDEEAPASPSTP